MQFTIGDQVLFKKDDLKGEIIRVNSLYKVTVLTDDGFEMNISIKDLVKVEAGTDKAVHKLLNHYGLRYYLSKDAGTTEVML